jgi:hypothetical protein
MLAGLFPRRDHMHASFDLVLAPQGHQIVLKPGAQIIVQFGKACGPHWRSRQA